MEASFVARHGRKFEREMERVSWCRCVGLEQVRDSCHRRVLVGSSG